MIYSQAVSNGCAEAFDIFANNKTVRNRQFSYSELIIVYKERERERERERSLNLSDQQNKDELFFSPGTLKSNKKKEDVATL